LRPCCFVVLSDAQARSRRVAEAARETEWKRVSFPREVDPVAIDASGEYPAHVIKGFELGAFVNEELDRVRRSGLTQREYDAVMGLPEPAAALQPATPFTTKEGHETRLEPLVRRHAPGTY
jgi:hypothetical protein